MLKTILKLPMMSIFIVLICMISLPYIAFASEDVVTFEKGYTANSSDLYQMAKDLVNRYAFLLELEDLGVTQDGRPIYVIRMTYNIYKYDAYDYVDKSHLLIDGGVHARETYNPVVVLKMIEDYVKDYYNDAYLPDKSVRELLKTSVIHFVPILNPDGFDVAKFGPESIQNPLVKANFISLIPNLKNNRLKSNLSGVDLNRNFEDLYYNTDLLAWYDLWGTSGLYRDTDLPDMDYFKGFQVASELETKTLMAYMKKYDFRAYLSYHSMGQVIYYQIDHLGSEFYNLNRNYALKIADVTGYKLNAPDKYIEYGFSTDYFANNTTKPAFTLETTNSFTFPTPLEVYAHEYIAHKLWEVPLEILEQVKMTGYYKYKIYVEDRYVQDVIDYNYAVAKAKALGGIVHVYPGSPSLTISKKIKLDLGENYHFENAVQSEALNIYVPFIDVFRQMGYEIGYDSNLNQASATLESKQFIVQLKTMEMFDSEGKSISLSKKPFIFDKRIMVPLDFAAALMDTSVDAIQIEDLGENIYMDLD